MWNDDDAEFLMPVLQVIETAIVNADRVGRAGGIALTDSQVRSILNKVRKTAEGGNPQIPSGSARDDLLAALYKDLIKVPELCAMEVYEDGGDPSTPPTKEPMPVTAWVAALRKVEASVMTHSSGSGSREYLTFIGQFVPEPGAGK
jgi:hypothetical protein